MAKLSLSALYNVVSRISNTSGTAINVSETKRVIACLNAVLSTLPTSDAMELVAKGIRQVESGKSKTIQNKIKAAKREVKKVVK